MPIESVTVFTAARMQEIEDQAITNATLSGDDLILHKNNGDTVNVGSVRGPQGVPGPINQTNLDNAIAASHPGCVLQTNANQSSKVPSGSWWNISWNGTDLRDTNSMHAAGSDIITIPITGWWNICGSVVWEASVAGPRLIRYSINGSGDYRMAAIGSEGMGARSCRVPFSQDAYLTQGQLLRISGMQESGASLDILTGSQVSVRFIAPA